MRTDRNMSLKHLSLDIILVITVWQIHRVVGTVSNVKISGPNFVDEDSSATFTCSASCTNASCTYVWSAVTGLTEQKKSSKLTIGSVVRKAGGGNYTLTCTASDNNGPAERQDHSLAVYYGPDSVKLTPSSGVLVVLAGTNYLASYAECTAISCYPECSIRWEKESVSVSTSQRLYGSNIEAKRDHAGNYRCFVTNPKRSPSTTKSSNLTLTVQYPPDVNATWDSSTKTLTCTASGVPAQYTFKAFAHYVNGIKIRDLIGSQTGRLLTNRFTAPTYQDRGDYKCSVSNGKPTGDTYKETMATVPKDEKPLLVSTSASYNVSKGSSLNITLLIYAKPIVLKGGVTFLQNSSELVAEPFVKVKVHNHPVTVSFYGKDVTVEGQIVTLNFDSVLEEYFGESDVKVANKEGHFITSIVLYPEGAPDPPDGLQVSDVSHDKLTLTFKSGFFNGASQTFVVEYRTMTEGSQWTHGSFVDGGEEKNKSLSATITNLSPETSYMIRAYSFNMYDRSNVTVVNTTTLEEPINVGLIAGVTAGSVVFVAIVIAAVVVVCCCKRRKGTRQDENKRTVPIEDLTRAEMNWPPIAHDNNVYDNTGANYENTRVENGRTFTNNKQGTSEPLYENNQTASNLAGSWKKSNQTLDSDDSITVQEGYLDLSGGNTIEEAYATKDVANIANTEEDYLNMDVIQTPVTPKHSFRNLERKPSKPQYQNVSKQIGLINQTQSNNDEPDEAYLDMDTIQTKPSARYKKNNSEEPYMAMSGKGTPSSARRTHKNPKKETSQYQNLQDTQPTACQGQAPYVSMSKKSSNRDSLPSYHAPPPPPAPLEEDYMNIQMSVQK